jgi:hypothetical protein
LFIISLITLVVIEILPSVRADPAAPLARVRARLPDLVNPRAAAALVLLFDVIILKGTFTSVKNMLPDMTGFRWDGAFASADAWLAGGADPWTRLQPFLGHHLVTRAIQLVYAAGWMLAVCSIPTLVGASRRASPIRARFFLTYIFCWVAMGNVMAGVFMSAGPAFFGEATGDVARFAAQMDYLSFSRGMEHSSFDYQYTLWQLHLLDRVELGTGISAFPSLHVAMATLFFLTGLRINRIAAFASGAFLAIIMLGSVHLAWHYAVDGLASMVLVTLVWFAIAGAERLRRTAAA